MISREDKLKFFVNELNDIKDPNLRKFAEELIGGAEEYFFSIAASTTGKYHPQFDLGEGGLVRHTRCVAYMANCLAISSMFSEHDTDLLIIAALAHDIKKLGDHKTEYTTVDHPTWAKKYVIALSEAYPEYISKDDANKIAGAVESHMGQWGHKDGLPLPKDTFEMALQNADYIASRKEILDFNFRPTENVTVNYEAPKPEPFNGDPGDFVIQFGKHKGKTIREVEPTGYLDWMIKQEDFMNKEAQEMARKFLNKKAVNVQPIVTVSASTSDGDIDDLPF